MTNYINKKNKLHEKRLVKYFTTLTNYAQNTKMITKTVLKIQVDHFNNIKLPYESSIKKKNQTTFDRNIKKAAVYIFTTDL